MSEDHSITWWIQDLKGGSEEAAHVLWQRYFQRMAGLARHLLGEGRRRVQDEDDIASSVFRSLCECATRGELEEMVDREDLWRLLTGITLKRVAVEVRNASRQKRGGGWVRGDSIFMDDAGLESVPGNEPTPALLHQVAEENRRLLDSLNNDTLRQIATWKMEGWTGDEIARELGVTRRSVERKVERIRELWRGELCA